MPPGVLIFEDPPMHTVHRSLLSRVFTPQRMAALEPKIREFCARSLDPLVGAGGFDFIADLGAQMPMRTIGMLLGIPEEDQEAIRDQVDAQPAHRGGRADGRSTSTTSLSGEMFAEYIDWRAEHPSDDLMTELLTPSSRTRPARSAGSPARRSSPTSTVVAGAGNETTTRLIGWTGKVLAEHPDQRRELVADRVADPERDRGAAALRAAGARTSAGT